jgi:hypothetical protein
LLSAIFGVGLVSHPANSADIAAMVHLQIVRTARPRLLVLLLISKNSR